MEQLAPSPDDERIANMLHALGNPMRLAIMHYIAVHPGCICNDLVVRFNRAQATMSQHLATLRRADMLVAERDGQATCYRINPDNVMWLLDRLKRLTID
jgi:ArsR family transcriptional regulator, arsenate/arsenite/antimonite-responsive transcriptional repressor